MRSKRSEREPAVWHEHRMVASFAKPDSSVAWKLTPISKLPDARLIHSVKLIGSPNIQVATSIVILCIPWRVVLGTISKDHIPCGVLNEQNADSELVEYPIARDDISRGSFTNQDAHEA
jgi:hypothetical protein